MALMRDPHFPLVCNLFLQLRPLCYIEGPEGGTYRESSLYCIEIIHIDHFFEISQAKNLILYVSFSCCI